MCLFRLVLPFERHIKGEEDKPLPPSKPRKPYKRNLEGKVHKAERKRKRTQSERDMDAEVMSVKMSVKEIHICAQCVSNTSCMIL